MNGTARFSPCGQYRYLLTRPIPAPFWKPDAGEAVFVMLNPSTADASEDDPTIRRCIGFAKEWGCTGLTVANLYALRSTDPKGLWKHRDPVGPENDATLAELAETHGRIICAWGANAKPGRVAAFECLMDLHGATLYSLATTKAGAPRHPLYLRGDSLPAIWSAPGDLSNASTGNK